MKHIHRTKAKIAKRNTKRRNNYSKIINTIDIILQQKHDRKKKTHKKSPNPKIKTMMKMCNKKRKPKTTCTSCYFQN